VKRRKFITLLGGASAWPVAARAQQPAMPVVGYLGISSPEVFASRLQAFRQGLAETGLHEGRNVTIDYHWAHSRFDRLPVLASGLVGRRPTVIVAAGSTASAFAVKTATTTIPVVFEIGGDPLAAGVVSSLSRPGGNVTGVTSLNVEVNPKRLELLHELIPNVKTVGLLVNPADRTVTEPLLPQMRAVAYPPIIRASSSTRNPPEPSPAGCDHGISPVTMRMHIRMITTTTTASINCTVTSYGLRLAIGPLLHRSLGSSRRGRRGPRPWLFRCVGQAHATETIAECIGGGGIGEAEANIGLLALVSAPAAADRDAPLTAKRIKV
jgi:hypothetical protein